MKYILPIFLKALCIFVDNLIVLDKTMGGVESLEVWSDALESKVLKSIECNY